MVLGNVLSWAGSGYVEGTLMCDTYHNIIADLVHPFMPTAFHNGSGLSQRDNVPCHTAQTILEWFAEHEVESKALPWMPNSPVEFYGASVGCVRTASLIRSGSTLQA